MANTCEAGGCERPVKARRLCNPHYRRWLKRGTTELERQPGGTCTVPSCSERTVGSGLCNRHYLRWKKYGDALYEAPPVDDLTQFWSNVDRREQNECWPWTGPQDASGYGLFQFTDESGRRKRTRAHRWLLGHLRGKPLSREVIGEEDGCHRCDNPPCCNPAHLYVGTRKQNIADAVERSRLWQLKKDTCPKGHPLDGVKTQRGTTRRFCKTCEALSSRERRTVRRRTCKNGHPLDGDNVLLCKNGTRKCRICDEARKAKIATSHEFVPGIGMVPKR